MIDNILGMIGLAKRAGMLCSGETLCGEKIKKRESALIIIAGDASDNSKKSIVDSCVYYNVPYVFLSTKSELGNYTGGGVKSVISINDKKFASAVRQKIESVERKDR